MSDERSSTLRRARFALRAFFLVLLGLPLLYFFAALIGALVPRNPGWEEPSQGIWIFVRDNGVHVDLVLPASAAGFDLYHLVSPAHIADPEAAGGWVAFGWGQREFYLETPRWADLTARNAARAVFGGDALMHIEHVARPRPSSDARPLRLKRQAYGRLVAGVTSGFVIRKDGRPIVLVGKGYADNDAFYEATGHYNAFRTSNQWTADMLADAGVKIGLWTPFAQGIMWRFGTGTSRTALGYSRPSHLGGRDRGSALRSPPALAAETRGSAAGVPRGYSRLFSFGGFLEGCAADRPTSPIADVPYYPS